MLAALLLLLPVAELVEQIERLPPWSVCGENMVFADQCIKALKFRLAVRSCPNDAATLAEAERLREAWGCACVLWYWREYGRMPGPFGGMGCWSPLWLRSHLIAAIGEEAYLRGELPPHVPLWRFREVGR